MINTLIYGIKQVIKKVIYPILRTFDLILLKRKTYDLLKSDFLMLDRLVRIHTKSYITETDPIPAEIVITSMDRAIQVHALIASIYEKFSLELPIHVLYKANSEDHLRAYTELIEIFSDKKINWVHQKEKATFKTQLIQILKSIKSQKMFFLVDDMVFTEDVNVKDFTLFDSKDYLLSLRHGKNLSYCYTMNSPQKLPNFINHNVTGLNTIAWIWDQGEFDWNYPISVDAHLFDTEEILALSENVDYTSPNWYENNLQKYVVYFKNRLGLCYEKSKVFNMPINKVNVDNENAHGEIDVNYLLLKWQEGYQIDYKKFYGFVNFDAHQECSIDFVKRD